MNTQPTVTDKQAQIEEYVRQGVDRATATRIVSATGRKPTQERREYAALNGERGFSLMR